MGPPMISLSAASTLFCYYGWPLKDVLKLDYSHGNAIKFAVMVTPELRGRAERNLRMV